MLWGCTTGAVQLSNEPRLPRSTSHEACGAAAVAEISYIVPLLPMWSLRPQLRAGLPSVRRFAPAHPLGNNDAAPAACLCKHSLHCYNALHGCDMPPWCIRAIRGSRQRGVPTKLGRSCGCANSAESGRVAKAASFDATVKLRLLIYSYSTTVPSARPRGADGCDVSPQRHSMSQSNACPTPRTKRLRPTA